MTVFVTVPKRYAMALLRRGLSFLKNHPKLQQNILVIIRRLGLYSIARAMHAQLATDSCQGGVGNADRSIPTDIALLSPRARQIYDDLNAAIKRHLKENG